MSRVGVRIHPSALCESEEVGSGTRVWAFAHVLKGAVVGEDCNIGDHAYIEYGVVLGDRVTVKNGVLLFEGVEIGDEVFLGPGCVFTNDRTPRAAARRSGTQLFRTRVEEGATIGANATIVCGTTIGFYGLVAAGAVVAADVPPHALVAGVPARQIGWACRCGLTLSSALTCTCGRSFHAVDGGVQED
jgi:UDP-2-acetamido-3-amino-2,3-dideoxy-glucuronate N-acetyltransferase